MKSIRWLCNSIVVGMLVSGILNAAYPTLANSTIPATQVTLSVQTGAIIATANIDTSATVGGIFGLNIIAPAGPRTTTINQSQTLYLSYQIKNNGNAADGLLVTVNQNDPNWAYQFVLDNNGDGVHQVGEATIVSFPVTVAAQVTYNFFLKLTPAILTDNIAVLGISTNAANVVQYTGFNSVAYGGSKNITATDNVIVTADVTLPYVASFQPNNNAVNVLPNTPVKIELADSGVGVSTGSVSVLFTGIDTSVGGFTISGDYVVAMLNGVIQTGFLLTDSYSPTGTYKINIVPNLGFKQGTEVKTHLNFADKAGNSVSTNYVFYTMATSGTETRSVSRPVAYPTIFNPDKNKTKIYFELSDDADITLMIYDLSGNRVYEDGKFFRAGNQFFEWDGMGKVIRQLGNGVYLFYILEDKKKVLGRGKVIIMREGQMEIN